MATEERVLLPTSWSTSWGWAFAGVVLCKNGRQRPGGFEAIHRSIVRAGLGKLGVANTFKKLFDYEEPPTDGKDIARAVVLLLAVKEDPTDPRWGLDVAKLPPLYGPISRLKSLLRTAPDRGSQSPACVTAGEPIAAAA